MIEGVEFRYLDVKWINKNKVKSLDMSSYTIPLEESEDGYSIETYTYQKYFPRLAIKIDGDASYPPYIKNGQRDKIEFLPLKDPSTGDFWWIHTDGWDSEHNYYRSELYRTVGVVDLIVENNAIKINNNSVSLSVEELEVYLQDFKDDLWQIILNQDSPIKGTISKSNNLLSEESLHLFKEFADSLESILKKPSVELKETQEQKPIKSVRPVNLTFREIATKGMRKQLTSRSYIRSLDTPDNRYLHYCSSRVLYIAKQLSIIVSKQEEHFCRIIKNNKQAIYDNSNRKTKIIPYDVFDDETKQIQKSLDEIVTPLKEAIQLQHSESKDMVLNTYQFRIGKPYNNLDGYFFVHEINGKKLKGDAFFQNCYAVIGVQPSIFSLIEKLKGGSDFLTLNCICSTPLEGWDNSRPERPFYYFFLNYVGDVFVPKQQRIEAELHHRIERRKVYEKSAWEVKLDTKELQELSKENDFISQKNKLFEQNLSANEDILKKVYPTVRRLNTINRFFKKNKIKRSAVFPNSMSFVQNPFYAKAESSFSKINKLDGMDGELFNSLFEFDQIGIINIPILYERWCLLQIIKLLSGLFGFVLSDNWQKMLIQSVIENKYNIDFIFNNPINNRRIILGYEKVLPNNRRPDFVLDLYYQGYVFKEQAPNNSLHKETEPSNINKVRYEDYRDRNKNLDSEDSTFYNWEFGDVQRVRYVLDAKFKDNLFQQGFDSILDDLIDNKNYDEDGRNRVFLLHPQGKAIKEKTSPLSWGGHSNYGQNEKHSKGYIFLLPSSKHGNTLDNLQRLLGMFLQNTSHFIDYGEKNRWFDTTCVSCGTSAYEDFYCIKKRTKGGKNSWYITCKKCSHHTIKTVCYVCSGDLYKNQFNLTYHRTKAEQVSNIVCPSCQNFL